MPIPDEDKRCAQCLAMPVVTRPGVDECVHCRRLRGQSLTLRATEYDQHPCVKSMEYKETHLCIVFVHEFSKADDTVLRTCVRCGEMYYIQMDQQTRRLQ